MKNRNIYIIGYLLAVLMSGCKKQGFTPPPEGERVPYQEEIKPTLKESLEQSSAQLFYMAWQRSNMDGILKAAGNSKSEFTILAPSDEALENGGYNRQKLQSMEPKDLDSLLMFYTLRNRITAADLSGKADNYIAVSLRGLSPVRISVTLGSPEAYFYKHHLQLKDGKTYVNGRLAGAGKSLEARDGAIWFLDQLIDRPTQSIMQVLEADERFSLLLGILQRTDEQYGQIIKEATGFEGGRTPFFFKFGWKPGGRSPNELAVTTLFLPTNDAFKAAGFNTLEDLEEFNRRMGLPRYIKNDQGSMEMMGDFATDILLNYHTDWGKVFITARYNYQVRSSSSNVPVFYSNVMSNQILSSYVIAGALRLDSPTGPDGEYYMPLDFSKDASGRIQVRVKDAEAMPATVTAADIYTLMGPIHAVDHLLIPKGFKMN